jgi:hypothetical protein
MWWIGEGARASIKRARRSRSTIEELAQGGARPPGERFSQEGELEKSFAYQTCPEVAFHH